MVVGGLSGGVFVALSIAKRELSFEIDDHSIYPLIALIPSIYGAIGPDIDLPNSKSGRVFRSLLSKLLIGLGAVLSCLVFGFVVAGKGLGILENFIILFIVLGFVMMFVKTSKHRGATHTLLLWLALVAPFIWMMKSGNVSFMIDVICSVYFGFLVGWLSHLLADSFNRKGVPWIFPISGKKFHVMSVLTGSYEETIFRYVAIVVFAIFYVLMILLWS
jgi:inner membrane protein